MPKFKFLAVVEVEGVYNKGTNPFDVVKKSEILIEPKYGPPGCVLKATLLGLKCGWDIIPRPTRMHYSIKTKANKSKTNWITK